MNPDVRYCTAADGMRIAFAERGALRPKGFDEDVRLFEARWRD